MAVLQVGEEAPDFDLPALIAGVKKRFRLSEQRGKKNIVLAFYPFNWDPISSRQMVAFQLERAAFLERNTETVAVSVESIMNTTAWEREIGPFDFPICSDFWPHGEVAQKYGVLKTAEPAIGAAVRAVFVIGPHGRVLFRRVYDLAEIPNVSDVLEVLRRAPL
jgi:alkyl hydroperoxide reductase subunit AhpC